VLCALWVVSAAVLVGEYPVGVSISSSGKGVIRATDYRAVGVEGSRGRGIRTTQPDTEPNP